MATTKKDIVLVGRIADDPEFTPAADGKQSRLNFGIVENDYQRVDGEFVRDDAGHAVATNSVYHPAVIFGGLAERAADTFQKGDAVISVGDLKFESYTETASSKKRTSHNFIVRSIGPNLSSSTVEIKRGPRADAQAGVSGNASDAWNQAPAAAPSAAPAAKKRTTVAAR